MQKRDHEKTKLAPKKKRRLLYVGGMLLALVALILPFFLQAKPSATLSVGQRQYALEIAVSDAAQQRGLSGRKQLGEDNGMLFIFKQPGEQCMWMKDMLFPLDIIWLDSSKKVTHIEANLSPATYPKQYCGDTATKYVIELNAGQAEKASIKVGTQVSI